MGATIVAGDGTHDFVFYRREDYAGFFRRCIAIGIDLVVLLILWIAYDAALRVTELAYDPAFAPWYLAPVWTTLFLYDTVLKRSRLSTVGYRMTGVRIVDLRGETPSMLQMTIRALLWSLGPLNPILDLLYATAERHRQPIRDLLVGTYVVRRNAQPIGTGGRASGRLSFMGQFMLIYPTVRADVGGAVAAES